MLRQELQVGEIAAKTDMKQPITSQHLKVLREASLVNVRIDGNRRLYRINFAGIVALQTALAEIWGSDLAALKDAVERRSARSGK